MDARQAARVAMVAANARRNAEEARERADRIAGEVGPEPTYPAEWAAEEDAMEDGLTAQYVADLWEQRQQVPSVLSQVREVTGGKMIRPTGAGVEWREQIPRHYLRIRDGIGADSVADMLGYPGEDALRAAIAAEVGTLATGRAQLEPEARQMARAEAWEVCSAHQSEFAAMLDRWQATRDAVEAAEQAAEQAEAIAADAEERVRDIAGRWAEWAIIAAGRHGQAQVAAFLAIAAGGSLQDAAEAAGQVEAETAPEVPAEPAEDAPAAVRRPRPRHAGRFSVGVRVADAAAGAGLTLAAWIGWPVGRHARVAFGL